MTNDINQSNALITRAQSGDAGAMAEMVENNIALVKFVIKRFTNAGRDWEDMYQLGCMGLVKAIRNFDISIGVRFSTYAVPVILGEVRRFMRDDGPMRVSRSIRDNARAIAAYCEKAESESGTRPSIDDIAANVGLSREDVILAIDSLKPTIS
ncbi:MAG: sigma-70 family RNA polymerase sigma factor, partial [Clostridia bacterium]|nr:sigma-70 family RNA polymerase sigma factor [Clostridia bacterium]